MLTKTSTGQEALQGNVGRNLTNPKSGGENQTGDGRLQLFSVGYSCALQLFPDAPQEVHEDHLTASHFGRLQISDFRLGSKQIGARIRTQDHLPPAAVGQLTPI